MTRARRASDWDRDLANARAAEDSVAALLGEDRRIGALTNHTRAFDKLDFSFTYRGSVVVLDVKEKRQRYSGGLRGLWPAVDERNLFVLDETVYRRIVWHGGGGYLTVHDVPSGRWVVLGPWDMTLGPRVRFGRWGEKSTRFLKGKVLMDLSRASVEAPALSVDLVARAIDHARHWNTRVDPYPMTGVDLPELG